MTEAKNEAKVDIMTVNGTNTKNTNHLESKKIFLIKIYLYSRTC